MENGLFSTALGLCLVLVSVDAYSEDLLDKSAAAISENIVMPMAKDLHRRMLEQQAKGEGIMADAARQELAKQQTEAMYAHDAEMLRRNQLIAEAKRCKVDCKPRPLMECMKPNYTVDDDVIGCSKGTIIKSW
jgi:hypothetical protein